MRRVFFSFDYSRDAWRAAQVRNSWLTKRGKASSFVDAAKWEKIKRGGDRAIKNWIESQQKGTSVTVVLIGKRTSSRKYVLYEIERSHLLGKGLLGIYIHGIKDQNRSYSWLRGENPFKQLELKRKNVLDQILQRTMASLYPTYYWISDNGIENMPKWIEEAARKARR